MHKNLKKGLKYCALFGNILYILWMLYNGIDEGFNIHGHFIELGSLIGLLLLLTINCILIKNISID